MDAARDDEASWHEHRPILVDVMRRCDVLADQRIGEEAGVLQPQRIEHQLLHGHLVGLAAHHLDDAASGLVHGSEASTTLGRYVFHVTGSGQAGVSLNGLAREDKAGVKALVDAADRMRKVQSGRSRTSFADAQKGLSGATRKLAKRGAELLAGQDLMRPWDQDDGAVLAFETVWQVVAPARLAVLGGLIAGGVGGLRAARLRPAEALRHID